MRGAPGIGRRGKPILNPVPPTTCCPDAKRQPGRCGSQTKCCSAVATDSRGRQWPVLASLRTTSSVQTCGPHRAGRTFPRAQSDHTSGGTGATRVGAAHVAPSLITVKVGTLVGAIALLGGCTGLVNVDNGAVQAENGSNSYDALMSADGTAVGFTSNAGNLEPGDANGAYDVFVRDLADKTTTRVSVGPGGA